jgi:putative SOS response-associated peptidase YedK
LSYTFINRDANGIINQIHNDGENKWRMPLMLQFEQSKKWFGGNLTDEDYNAILDFEMPSEELNCLPVYTIRSPKLRPDDKTKKEYYEWENLPELEYEEEQ